MPLDNNSPLALIGEITTLKSAHVYATPSRIPAFIVQINADRMALNQRITEYNQETDLSLKMDLLERIAQETNDVLSQYQASYLAYCADVTLNIQIELFEGIKEQRNALEARSLLEKASAGLPTTPRDCSLPNIIARMSFDKMAQLMEILHDGSQFDSDEIATLYSNTDPKQEKESVTIHRTLIVTELCSGGDLQDHLAAQKTPTERIESALSIYQQMSRLLIDITNDGCAFPDMKNSNWLIDPDGTIPFTDEF